MGVKLPLVKSEITKLADWVELTAVVAPSHRASSGDLESVLRKEGVTTEQIAEQLADVFKEFNARALAAGAAYPFDLLGMEIVHRHIEDHPSYLFCLCASYLAWSSGGASFSHARIFEELCTVAAQNFVAGESRRFGSPRDGTSMPTGFLAAIKSVSTLMGEGDGGKQRRAFNAKDEGVDIIAWRNFKDELQGKMLLLGQCACGDDWKNKTHELQPDKFLNFWFKNPPVSPAIRAFFVPHRVPFALWTKVSGEAGIVFDRCRIAHTIESGPASNLAPYRTWAQQQLALIA